MGRGRAIGGREGIFYNLSRSEHKTLNSIVFYLKHRISRKAPYA